jgi:hypothetical protein
MSGGHFNYQQSRIHDISDEIEYQITRNGETSEYGYTTEYSPEVIKEFYNAIYQLRKAFIYAQRIDWFLSADDGEKDFHERLAEELKILQRQHEQT